eukprot:TRINITY_DN76_c0_g3_i5.p1 TRINITY_DN76_c0_g3~~TRINITY_DN76_c0_g3_i5.p1  ORF type:complete len:1392 (-),score=495.17 TRINITY_DN76_c0_g3_i5:223-3981(-)
MTSSQKKKKKDSQNNSKKSFLYCSETDKFHCPRCSYFTKSLSELVAHDKFEHPMCFCLCNSQFPDSARFHHFHQHLVDKDVKERFGSETWGKDATNIILSCDLNALICPFCDSEFKNVNDYLHHCTDEMDSASQARHGNLAFMDFALRFLICGLGKYEIGETLKHKNTHGLTKVYPEEEFIYDDGDLSVIEPLSIEDGMKLLHLDRQQEQTKQPKQPLEKEQQQTKQQQYYGRQKAQETQVEQQQQLLQQYEQQKAQQQQQKQQQQKQQQEQYEQQKARQQQEQQQHQQQLLQQYEQKKAQQQQQYDQQKEEPFLNHFSTASSLSLSSKEAMTVSPMEVATTKPIEFHGKKAPSVSDSVSILQGDLAKTLKVSDDVVGDKPAIETEKDKDQTRSVSHFASVRSDSTPFGTDLIDTMPEKPEEEQQKEQQQQFSMFSHFSAKPSIETSSATAPFSWREEDLLQKKKLLKERVTGKESDTAPVVEKGSFGGFLDTFGYEEDKKEDTIKQQQQKLEENFQGSFNLSSPEKDKEVPKTSDESPVKMTPSRIIDNSDKSAAVTAMTTTSDWLAVEKQLSDMLIRDDNDDDKEKEKEEEEKYDDKKVTKPTESTLEIESTSKPTETVPYKVYKDEELTISTKYPVNTMPMPSPVIEPEEMAKFKSPYTHVFTLNSKTYNYYQHLHWPAGKMRCCDDCDFMHRLPRRMSNHYFSEHFSKTKDTEVECPWCEEHVNLHGDMLDHIEKHLINNDGDINEKFEEKDLICRFCLQKFESLLDVFRHTMSLDHLIWHSFMAARYCCRRFRWLLHPEEKIEEPVSSSVSEASSSVVSRSSSKAPLSRSPPLKPAIAKLHQQKHQHIKKPFSLDSDRASTRREPRISSDRSVSSVRSKHSLKSSSRPPLSPPLLPKSTRSDRSMSRGGIHSGSSVSSGRKSHYKETTQQVYSVRQKNLEKQKQRQQPLHFQKQLPRHEETPYISPSRESTIEEPIIPFSNKAYLDEDYDDYADSDFREDTESMSMRHSDPSSSETVASYRTPKIPSSVSEVDAESEVIPVSREEKAILLRMRAEREEEAMAVSKEEREILMQLRRQKQQEQQHYQSPPLSEVPSFYPSGTSQEQDYSFTSQSMEAPEFVPSSYIREEPSSLHQYRQRFPSGQQQQRQQRPRGRPPKNLHRTAAPFQPSHKPFRADSSAGRVISFGDPDPYGDIPAPPMYDDGDYYEAPVRHYQQPQPSQQQQQHQPIRRRGRGRGRGRGRQSNYRR